MKTIAFLLLFGLSSTLGYASEGKNPNTIENVTIYKIDKKIPTFNSIVVSNNIEVEVYYGEEKISITTTNPENLNMVVEQGLLVIHHKTPVVDNKTKVVVYTKNLNNIEANLASTVKVMDQFQGDVQNYTVSGTAKIFANPKADVVNIKCNTGGVFTGEISSDNLDVFVDSFGEANVSGKANVATFKGKNSARVNGEKFMINYAKALTVTSSKINIGVSKLFEAKAISISNIKYKILDSAEFFAENFSTDSLESL